MILCQQKIFCIEMGDSIKKKPLWCSMMWTMLVASLTDGYPISARMPLSLPEKRRGTLPYKVCFIFGELELLKSYFLKSLAETYVPKIFFPTDACFIFWHYTDLSRFTYAVQSFISSFFIQGVFYIFEHLSYARPFSWNGTSMTSMLGKANPRLKT